MQKLKDVVVADKTKVINIGMPENAIVVGIIAPVCMVGFEEEGKVVRYIEK